MNLQTKKSQRNTLSLVIKRLRQHATPINDGYINVSFYIHILRLIFICNGASIFDKKTQCYLRKGHTNKPL